MEYIRTFIVKHDSYDRDIESTEMQHIIDGNKELVVTNSHTHKRIIENQLELDDDASLTFLVQPVKLILSGW